MSARSHVDAWIKAGGRPQTDLEARLVARVPGLAESLSDRFNDPIHRALAGLEGDPTTGKTLDERIRLGVAGYSYELADLFEMEEAAKTSGDPHLWVMAARLHAEKNIGREAAARMALSEHALPYVFPGELHPMMVDLLAIGERVSPALHVDWIRKLTVWAGSAIALDCKVQGMWFWPVLQCLDAGKMVRPLNRLAGRRLPDGSKGLAAAYAETIGVSVPEMESDFGERDRLVLALFHLGNQVL